MFAIKELDPHWKGGLECNWGRCGKPHSYGESGRSSVCVGVYGVCSVCAFLPCFCVGSNISTGTATITS